MLNKKVVKIENGMTENEIVFNILEATGTNWSVEKERLVSVSGRDTGSVGIFRSDNGLWLGSRTDQYEPMQNHELVHTLYNASAGIGEAYQGGNLQDGKKVFYQIALPDYKVGNDTLKRWVTALNSHDGSSSIGFGSTNTVVVCQNTFYKAYKDVAKFRHTASASERIRVAAEELRATIIGDGKLMESFERMTDHKIDRPIFDRVLKSLFGNDSNAKASDVSTRKRNSMLEFDRVLAGELQSHGNTLWGLFNAVTYFENHIRPKEGKAEESIYLGVGNRNMNTTYDEIMAWIDDHTAKFVPVG